MTDADVDDDAAFVRDLLAFLDADTPLCAPADAPPVAPSRRSAPTGGAARMKRSLDDLRAEACALTEQLQRLTDAHGAERVAAKALALTERNKRLRAEDECRALREAVYTQRRFIRGLRSVFSATPRFAVDLDLCRYLHRHTRLARDRSLRWGEFDQEAHDATLRSAMDVLCHETEAMTLSADSTESYTGPLGDTPLINGEATDRGDCYATTAMAVYAVDSTDLSAVVRATCVAVRGVATMCGSGHPLEVSRDIIDVDASPASNMLYRVMAVNHQCVSTGEELSIETHALTSYKITDNYAIVLWDFVDVDELHPTPDTTNISREVTGACLIRREWCDDGVERMVFRSLTTKKFRFMNQESANKLRRFACITHPTALVRGNEMLFRRIIMDQLAAENKIYASTQVPTTQ